MSKRTVMFLVFAAILPIFSVNAAEIVVDSKIAQVTVYPDSALISRVTNLKFNSGKTEVVFANIVPDLDEDSLRVAVSEQNDVKILGAKVKKEFLEEEAEAKVRQLKEGIEKLQDEIKKFQNNKNTLDEEKKFLDSIRLFSGQQIPKDLVTKMPQVKELEDILKFLDTKLKDNFQQDLILDLEIRGANKKIDVLRRELNQLSGTQHKFKRSIIVELEALRGTSCNLTVSYLVRAASWQPLYDARADFDKTQVELVSYGIVRQTTGEDWQDIEISLSTAKPSIGGNMPYVAPWILKPYQPRVLESKSDSADRYGAYSQRAAFEGPMEEAGVASIPYAAVEEKGIAVVYKLPNKATIKADGTEQKLLISSQILKAEFKYSAYPRAILSAYLGSRVTNNPSLQLLGGRVNIFLSGDFVGTSTIENIGPGEEFDLYLGADENVKVKREQIEKKVDETLIGSIPSPTKKTTFTYKLKVENYKTKKISVKLFEAMPVPEDDKIKVKMLSVSLEPKEKDWKDRKGIWLWELELNSKEKKEITYSFVVEHPRNMNVEGL